MSYINEKIDFFSLRHDGVGRAAKPTLRILYEI